jgi:inner membrane protein involved in colicin E2 resistance
VLPDQDREWTARLAEDYALLIGSIGLSLMLAAVRFLIRGIDCHRAA